MSEPRSAAALFRSVGLLPDGPVLWGRPLPAVRSGVVVIELLEPAGASAPIDPARVGKWLERVPSLRLDGAVPTTRRLVARLASYWIPGQTVLFVGYAATDLGRRVAALPVTSIGNRPPLADAHWLLVLRRPEILRLWWAATDAPEEYADALLDAFAEGVAPEVAAALPEPDLVLPWATLRRPTGEARRHGLTDDLLDVSPAPAPASSLSGRPRTGAGTPARATAAGSGAGRRGAEVGRGGTEGPTRGRRPRASQPAVAARHEPVHLSAEGLERLRAELDHLRRVERPAIIARVRAARELGDLRENAEYQAAREEQAFLEGRIQALEDRLRRAVVVDRRASEAGVGLGSVVLVEVDGRIERYEIVGPAEADPKAGRLSVRSPIGAALLGARPGDDRVVATPSGERHLRVVALE
ncbi:MAG: hypothetical protein KatS3mg065_0312 [Chloroflexota bacterium]|nr:MAG: hypothetical protein KatS3mg065_0312 [Chloroflexota bacterium]